MCMLIFVLVYQYRICLSVCNLVEPSYDLLRKGIIINTIILLLFIIIITVLL